MYLYLLGCVSVCCVRLFSCLLLLMTRAVVRSPTCGTATHCNTLQHTATHCNTLQHTATHCNTLQHTATHCNTLQRTATLCTPDHVVRIRMHICVYLYLYIPTYIYAYLHVYVNHGLSWDIWPFCLCMWLLFFWCFGVSARGLCLHER